MKLATSFGKRLKVKSRLDCLRHEPSLLICSLFTTLFAVILVILKVRFWAPLVMSSQAENDFVVLSRRLVFYLF